MLGYAGRIALIAYTLGGMVVPAFHGSHHCGTGDHPLEIRPQDEGTFAGCACVVLPFQEGIGKTSTEEPENDCTAVDISESEPVHCDGLCVICGFVSSAQQSTLKSETYEFAAVPSLVIQAATGKLHLACYPLTDAPRGPPGT